MARTDRAIFPTYPIGTAINVPEGAVGLRKDGDDRWEMVESGRSTGKFISDDFARVLFESTNAELDIPLTED